MSEKLTQLTEEQQAMIPVYVERGLAAGLNTTPFTLERATEIIHLVQVELLQRKATPVVVARNPQEAWDFTCQLAQLTEPITQEQLPELLKTLPVPRTAYTSPWLQGAADSGMLTYYEFWMEVCNLQLEPELKRKLEIWIMTRELGLIFPLEFACIVLQHPSTIHKIEAGLHCETGPAVHYDGWDLYSLNGVRVPEYLVMTPSEDMEMDWYQKQSSADVRAEFVRKYGVERMLELGKKIDSYEKYPDETWWQKSEYELWDMAVLFEGLSYQPYLKMKNQTTDIWHVEAVSPACHNLKEAIAERFDGEDFTIASIS